METTVFLSNRSQAVRLPKAVALPEDVKKVEIIAIGRTRIITPAGESWDSWFDGENVSADFMDIRDQPAIQILVSSMNFSIKMIPFPALR
ncbi:type II toxin-antitoxin system VapB family antitoxin, partial [Escherichia sp. SP-MK2]